MSSSHFNVGVGVGGCGDGVGPNNQMQLLHSTAHTMQIRTGAPAAPATNAPAMPPFTSPLQSPNVAYAVVNQMPQPAQVPWSADAMSWTNSPTAMPPLATTGVVHFNGQAMAGSGGELPKLMPLHKRKAMDCEPIISSSSSGDGSDPFGALPLPKRHITDEQMALHLNGMHISSQFTSHQRASSAFAASNASTSTSSSFSSSTGGTSAGRAYNVNKDLQRKLRNAQRITICDEIRRIQTDPLLPDSLLLQRIERPCTALVLWQPPPPKKDDGDGARASKSPSSQRDGLCSDMQENRDEDNNCPTATPLAAAVAMAYEDLDNNNSNSSMDMDL